MEQLLRINGAVATDRSKLLLGPAFAHTSVGISIAQLDGSFVEANDAFLRIVGRSFDGLGGETVGSLTHVSDRETTRLGIEKLVAGSIPNFSQQKRYVRPDGTNVWVINSVSLLRDDRGQPCYTMAITEDIDVARRAEDEALRARETLEIATTAGGVGIWDVDMISGAMDWSPICRDIFGVPHDAPLTLDNFYAGLHPEDRDRLREIVARVVDPEVREQYDAQYRVVRANGEVRWGHATGRAYFSPAADAGAVRCVRFIGAIRDITEQRGSIDALIQAEKLAATGRLAASIAHEINNPLESVTNLLFLLRETEEENQRRAFLALAEEEIKRVTEIATQTLRFYRDPAGPTRCDIARLLDSVLALFHGRLNLLSISVSTRFAPNCIVHGAQGELRQVFVNLVSNALDAMSMSGNLQIRVRLGHHPRSSAAGVWVTIADSGEGMSADTVAHIFQPFFTTKKTTGTGLGLWLSLEILNKHKATIRMRSRQQRGTVFQIFLPSAL